MAGLAPAGQCFPPLKEIQANPIVAIVGKDNPKIDLAFDLSSSCVGWAVGVDKELARYGKFVFKSTAEVGEKLVVFEEFLGTLILTMEPDRLLLERPMTRRANTTIRHTELVGIVRKVWRQMTDLEILDSWIISPITVKAAMNVKRGADHEQNKKIMVAKINDLYGLNLKFDKNSKLKTDDDTADAIAVMTTAWRRGGL